MVSPEYPTGTYPDPLSNPEDRRLDPIYLEQSRRLQSLLELGRLITLDLNLDTLLSQIAQKTPEIIKADRCSVFLYDMEKDELWSTVALGLGDRIIRIPAGTGLAGACFRSGQPIDQADVYQDVRFNPVPDRQTGYRTRSPFPLPPGKVKNLSEASESSESL